MAVKAIQYIFLKGKINYFLLKYVYSFIEIFYST